MYVSRRRQDPADCKVDESFTGGDTRRSTGSTDAPTSSSHTSQDDPPLRDGFLTAGASFGISAGRLIPPGSRVGALGRMHPFPLHTRPA